MLEKSTTSSNLTVYRNKIKYYCKIIASFLIFYHFTLFSNCIIEEIFFFVNANISSKNYKFGWIQTPVTNIYSILPWLYLLWVVSISIIFLCYFNIRLCYFLLFHFVCWLLLYFFNGFLLFFLILNYLFLDDYQAFSYLIFDIFARRFLHYLILLLTFYSDFYHCFLHYLWLYNNDDLLLFVHCSFFFFDNFACYLFIWNVTFNFLFACLMFANFTLIYRNCHMKGPLLIILDIEKGTSINLFGQW